MLAGGVNGVLSPNCDSVERTAGTDGFKERFSSMCHTGVERKTHMFSKKYAGLSKVERPAVGLLLSGPIVLLGWKAERVDGECRMRLGKATCVLCWC